MFKQTTLNYKVNFVVRILFILAFIETVIVAIVQNDYSNIVNAFTAVLGFALTFIPEAVENITKNRLHFSNGVNIAIVLFIFCAELLGEIRSFYDKYPWWDILLHGLSGVILGLIGFMLVYALNASGKKYMTLSPILVAAFAFFFALSCGAIWEIFEFIGDRLFNMNMQKFRPPIGVATLFADGWRYDAGLIDTMMDIIMDAICAFGVSAIGYIKIKTGKWYVNRKQARLESRA